MGQLLRTIQVSDSSLEWNWTISDEHYFPEFIYQNADFLRQKLKFGVYDSSSAVIWFQIILGSYTVSSRRWALDLPWQSVRFASCQRTSSTVSTYFKDVIKRKVTKFKRTDNSWCIGTQFSYHSKSHVSATRNCLEDVTTSNMPPKLFLWVDVSGALFFIYHLWENLSGLGAGPTLPVCFYVALHPAAQLASSSYYRWQTWNCKRHHWSSVWILPPYLRKLYWVRTSEYKYRKKTL